MEKFWPGPITFLFKKSDLVPSIITGGLDTVAIRMPENQIALSLIREAGVPIAAPSANLSGRPSPTSASHVIEDLSSKVDIIIDGGQTGIGLESTVLDLSVSPPMILRPGGITKEDLVEVIPDVDTDRTIINEDKDLVPKSPGQKYRHYAPRAEMEVYRGRVESIVQAIIQKEKEYTSRGKKVGIICTDETIKWYNGLVVISMGSRENKETIARNLFNILRGFNDLDVDIILAEAIDLSDMGTAIMNRMTKAASGKIFDV